MAEFINQNSVPKICDYVEYEYDEAEERSSDLADDSSAYDRSALQQSLTNSEVAEIYRQAVGMRSRQLPN